MCCLTPLTSASTNSHSIVSNTSPKLSPVPTTFNNHCTNATLQLHIAEQPPLPYHVPGSV